MELLHVSHGEISPNDYNPNRTTPTEYRNIRYSIETYGLVLPILVRKGKKAEKANYIIVDGEQRWRIAGELNYQKIPVVLDQGKEDQERYKQLTIILDEFRGDIDKDIVAKILNHDREDVSELLKRMKIDRPNKGISEKSYSDFVQETPDWDDDSVFQVDTEHKNLSVPYTITMTQGELETFKDFEKMSEEIDTTVLTSIWNFVSKREMDEDERFFCAYMLALRRALTTKYMPFRDNPERPMSIVYRDTPENVEKVVNYIKDLRENSKLQKKNAKKSEKSNNKSSKKSND
jgi:hypothetical protein